jgi:hypothetical protein
MLFMNPFLRIEKNMQKNPQDCESAADTQDVEWQMNCLDLQKESAS